MPVLNTATRVSATQRKPTSKGMRSFGTLQPSHDIGHKQTGKDQQEAKKVQPQAKSGKTSSMPSSCFRPFLLHDF
jgi:hypothetical protein